jgi:hypothetical protein
VTEDAEHPTKRCKTCGQVKPVTDFYRGDGYPDGYRTRCKACFLEEGRKRRLENYDKTLERERQWREDNREVIRERSRQWARDNMDQQVEYQRQYTAELKTQVLAHYGKVCKCCGCDDFDYLTVDHIDGNGGEHRVELFGNNKAAGRVFYLWLIRNGFPDGYQTLCKSCNYSKGKTPQCRKDHGREGGQLAG